MTKEISIAPMMDWTDRHCRYFHRLISPNVLLYTEMVTMGAIIHGDRDRFLRFNAEEHPAALQLGGDDPQKLAECARIGADYGYDEINLNCGCPSDRVQSGNFGACLMTQPELVAKCVDAMDKVVDIPITVKCRIAIDEYEELPFLNKFIDTISKANCQKFIIHARKAWLKGLSPKENRDIPPLRYDVVQEIKNTYPNLKIIVNGGIKTINDIKNLTTPRHSRGLAQQSNSSGNPQSAPVQYSFNGTMIGREAYQNPYILAEIEQNIFKNRSVLNRNDVAIAMIDYIQRQNRDHGTPIKSITRHMTGLFKHQPGGAQWRRHLSENAHLSDNAEKLITDALGAMNQNTKKAA